MKLIVEVEHPNEEINCEILHDLLKKGVRRLPEEDFQISEIKEKIYDDEISIKFRWEGVDNSDFPLPGSYRSEPL